MDQETNKAHEFDASRQIVIKLPPDGARAVKIRFPNDDEWAVWQAKNKAVQTSLGRGKTQTKIDKDASRHASMALVNHIGGDEGNGDLSGAEAAYIVRVAGQAEVRSVERSGKNWHVQMRVLGADVTHVLRGPSLEETDDYRGALADVIDLPHGRQQITLRLGVAGETYDKLIVETTGYASAVPIIHKHAAVRAVLDEIDLFLQEDESEGN